MLTPLDAWIAARIGSHAQHGPSLLADLRAWQLRALRESLAWAAAHAPFHRERLGGLTPGFPESLDDVARLPFTDADMLRHEGARMLCVSQDAVARVVTLGTSGSTGPPKRVHFTDEDILSTVDFFRHGMSTMLEPGQRVLVLLPGGSRYGVCDLLRASLEHMGVVCRQAPTGWPSPPLVRALETFLPHCLVALPSQMAALADDEGATRAARRSVRVVLCSGEPLPDGLESRLADIFGWRVRDHYGMTEMGYGGGVECGLGMGYHLRHADLYFEVVDPLDGRTLPPGQTGEAVFTTLTRRGMPLVRYRTGDAARLLEEPCGCGSLLPRLERVPGRIVIEDGRARIVQPEKGGQAGNG